jgi:predicted DNA-binding ribbon-helix-helix protein
MAMATLIKKHSIDLHGHQTSVSMEDDFWDYLKKRARNKGMTLGNFVDRHIDTSDRNNDNLSSAIRLYLFNDCRTHGQKT